MPKQAVGLLKEKEIEKQTQQISYPYNDYMDSLNFYTRRFDNAKQQREVASKYFDDRNYTDDYTANENMKNTYLRKKINDSEVRVNTGTAEKKLEAIQNELLTMNLQHEVRAFDKDDLEIAELGADMGDLVSRTNYMEKDEDFWIEATAELLTQRTVFIEECYSPIKIKRGKTEIYQPKKKLVSGLKMFLGDITIPAYRQAEQPYQFKYDRLTYEEAEAYFGNLPNWKYVKKGAPMRDEHIGTAYDYRFGQLASDEVEIITYASLPDDEYQVIINGVMMYEPGTKLPWSYDHYNIRMFVLKSMSPDFAYGKPLTASAKTLQALSNETIRLMIRKFQQAIEPPLAVPKGKIYSRNIWDPGAVTQGIKANEFERLIDHQGVTAGELAMYRLIEEKTEEFIGASNIAQGMASGKEITATEVLQMTKQFVKQLGLAVYAISRMKRDMTEIRLYTIFDNMLDPIRKTYDSLSKEIKEVYRSFTIDDAYLENEKRGKKIIQFTDKNLSPQQEEQLYEFEEEQKKRGNNLRIKFINAKRLKEIFVNWYIVVTAQEKEGTALDKVVFQDKLKQGIVISKIAGRLLSGDKIIDDYQRTWKAKDWFQIKAPAMPQMGVGPDGQPMQPGMGEGGNVSAEANKLLSDVSALEAQSVGEQVSGGLRRSVQRPALNTAMAA